MANNQMTEYQREEIRIREKEIELRREALSLQRRWFRNPTIIAGLIMAYVTVTGSALSLYYSHVAEESRVYLEEAKVALSYIELATEIAHKPDSSDVDEQWARRIFEHFKNAPFRIAIDNPPMSENEGKEE